MNSWESRKPCKCPGQGAYLEKTWEGPKLSLLADLQALHKQEVKAKAVVNCLTECKRRAPTHNTCKD